MAGVPTFATFWHGDLSPFEAACIASYVVRGYDITVYSYTPLEDLPPGATPGDAATIVKQDALSRFIYRGKPNLSHFSDYFRYLLFKKTDRIWVDADMLLVRPIDTALPDTLLTRESPTSICGAIMRLGDKDQHLDRLITQAEACMGRELQWGETGPRLLTKEFGQAALLNQSFGPERFYAITHDDFWKVFLPEFAEECEARTAQSWGVHLWNNIVDTLGYWKLFAPPRGSFLHAKFAADAQLPLFKGIYPEEVMRRMTTNFRLRKTGEELGIRQISTQLLPSIRRTIGHYWH